jgi:hypothetical protein
VLGSHCVLWTRNQAPVNHLSETFTKLSFHHYPSFFAPPDFDLVLWHVSFLYDILEYSIDSSPAAYLDQDDTERVYIMLTAERRVRLTLSFGVPVQVGEYIMVRNLVRVGVARARNTPASQIWYRESLSKAMLRIGRICHDHSFTPYVLMNPQGAVYVLDRARESMSDEKSVGKARF